MYAAVYVRNVEASLRPALRACAEAFSPRVQEPSTGLWVFDVRGLERLHGTSGQLAKVITDTFASTGAEARIALAADPQTAAIAARGLAGTHVLHEGNTPELLASLPLALLEPEPDLAATLAAWGIRSFADFAALDERGVAERLGPAGVKLHRTVRGVMGSPLVADKAPLRFEASLDLDHPVELLEPLSFLISRLLHDICGRLGSHGYATNEITVTMTLEGQIDYARQVRVPFAGRDPAVFLKLVQFDLAAHPPGAGVTALRVRAEPVQPRRVQGGLFLPRVPEAEKLELTLARLAAVVGEGNVGSPELLDTWRPDAWRMVRFTTGGRPGEARPPAPPVLALRRYRPPLAARVALENGRPEKIESRDVRGRIASSAGPWRASGEWWRRDAWARDEWDIALDRGGSYRIFRLATPAGGNEWYVDGTYD